MAATDTKPSARGFGAPTNLVTRTVAITPHDTNTLAEVSDGILVGAAGNLNCILADETVAKVLPVPAGFSPLRVKQVLNTSTTASGLFACYCG